MRSRRPVLMLITLTALSLCIPTALAVGDTPFPSLLKPDLAVARMEVTQGMQTADNTVVLIDYRATTVRVGIDAYHPFFNRVANVDARLRIYRDSTLLVNAVSDNGPITAPEFVDRDDADDTLNFTWTPSLNLLGDKPETLTFEVTVDPADVVVESNEDNNTAEFVFEFECRRGPTIAYLPIDFQDRGAPDDDLIEPGVGDAMVWGMLPWSQGPGSDRGRYEASGLSDLDWDASLQSRSDYGDLLRALGRQRNGLSPVPDHLYGWLPGNPCPCNGAGSTPGTVAYGNTDTARHQRTFAHELGHNMGYGHVGRRTGEIGWDVGDRLGLGPVKDDRLNDIMVAGLQTDQAWIEPDRYRDILGDNDWACVDIPSPTLIEALLTGIRAIEAEWALGSTLLLVSRRPEIEVVEAGRGELRILREEEILYRQHFEPGARPDSEGDEPSGALVVTPSFPTATRHELYIDGELVDKRERSKTPPEVTIIAPEPGATLEEGTEIAWEMNDADGDAVKAFVRYSPDGESGWIPLGPLTENERLRLKASLLPSSTSAQIEVRVTDGFDTSRDVVGNLRLGPNRLPRASILQPSDGRFVGDGANVTFVGQAVDPEDGELEEDALTWWSSIDGFLGEGTTLNVSELSQGAHVIDLVAEDTAGAEGRTSVTLHYGMPAGGPTPGEASPPASANAQLRVTDYDEQTGAMTIDYDPACGATDHRIHYGDLANVKAYDYSATECSVDQTLPTV